MTAADLLGPLDTPVLRNRLLPVRPESVPVRPAPRWLRRVWPRWVAAMTWVRVIYVRPDVLAGDPQRLARLIAHELVHVRQWRTDGVVGFCRHYLTDYARGRALRLGHRGAYRAVAYEAEAYDFEELL